MSDSTSVENGKRTITIKGVAFEYVERYRANNGTIERLTNGVWSVPTDEMPMLASRITQDMSQNLGNSHRPDVQEALDKAGVADGAQLPADVLAKLREDFAEMVAEYEFGGTRGARGPRDPVKNLTMNYLENMVKAAAVANPAKYGSNFSDTHVKKRAIALYERAPDKYRAEAQADAERRAKAAAKRVDDDFDAVMAA